MKWVLVGAVLGRAMAMLAFALPVAVLALGDEIPLPPGYEYPRLPTVKIPDPLFDEPNRCPSCADEDSQLRFYYKDYVGFRRNLDTYAPYTCTWELLVFEHGFKQAWLGPQFAARLYQHSADEVRFVTRERLVVFRKTTDAEGKATLKCISEDDWSIRREGERVIVQSPQRWFAFDTPDYGQTWRLVETCFAGIPVPVKLHYDGPIDSLPSSLEYPDGKTAAIEPAPGLEAIGRLKLPNGMEYKLEYDPNGFPRILEEYALSKEPPKKELHGFTIERKDGKVTQTLNYRETSQDRLVLTRRWVWENDAEGRIRHFVAPCGKELKVEIARATSDAGDETTAVVTDLDTGAYRYQRHTESAGTWTIDRGHGHQGQPLAEAGFDQRTVQKRMNHEMKVVELRSGSSPNVTTVEYDSKSNEVGRTGKTPDGQVVWEVRSPASSAGSTPSWNGEGGRVTAAFYPGQPAVAYGHEDKGLLAWAEQNGLKHRFETDDLGRLRVHLTPDGRRRRWEYNSCNRVERFTDCPDMAKGPEPSPATFPATARELLPAQAATSPPPLSRGRLPIDVRFGYDECLRLASVEIAGESAIACRYACDGLVRWRRGEQERSLFSYENHRLKRRLDERDASVAGPGPSSVETRYKYHDDGRVKAMQRTEAGAMPQTVWYTYDSNGLRHLERTEGPIPAKALTTAVRSFGFGNAAGTVSALYNELGAVVKAPE